MTTKERADAYIGHSWEVGEDPAITMARNGYESGYKDAIDKACRWLAEHYHIAETIGKITCTSVMTEGLLEDDFRKDMEG